ncbi:endonuclease/exonuclease/phosphatase family protein [Metapseudomonas furukawaii]|uniref:endonuclease/exonuclease/phosphatase family protein n=1 Tax=Metapseudomonas furukawaii TaxID=1149133 RepID=UPI00227B6CA7|nr:endonuclease/exonuclease/phosphatase family protein [Pseudomonas furukawaii]WAG79848.1 endonuclease/exonuclease/phosphatase family protein [Pseudomonas furukawaii]
MPRVLRFALLSLSVLAVGLIALIYALTWHPAAREPAPLACQAEAPQLQPGQALKVMTWNLQYLAGKRYVFHDDLPDGEGRDERPTADDLAYSLDEVVRVIREEQPDIVNLQELHDGARATDYQDQLALLQERLADLYPCASQAFYWKAAFVPDPQVLGSVGLKLATLSRFGIQSAERLQLPQGASDPISRQFDKKRALLVSYLPIRGGGRLAVINTHLDALADAPEILRRQVAMTHGLLDQLQRENLPWVLAGDFSQLPPGQYDGLAQHQRQRFARDSELKALWDRFPMIPSLEEASGDQRAQWFTHFPNDPRAKGPDRTLDYLFHSPSLTRIEAKVRQVDTLRISDHLPLTARFFLPSTP